MSSCFAKFHPNLVVGGTYSGQIVLWDNRVLKRTPIQRTPLSAAAHTVSDHCLFKKKKKISAMVFCWTYQVTKKEHIAWIKNNFLLLLFLTKTLRYRQSFDIICCVIVLKL